MKFFLAFCILLPFILYSSNHQFDKSSNALKKLQSRLEELPKSNQKNFAKQNLNFLLRNIEEISLNNNQRMRKAIRYGSLHWVEKLAAQDPIGTFKIMLRNTNSPNVSALEDSDFAGIVDKINTQDEDFKDTILHIAARIGNYRMIRKALYAGANPNIKNKDGDTVLHLITAQYYNPKHTNHTDRPYKHITEHMLLPIDETSFNEHDKTVALLIQHGAKTDTANNDKITPLHLLCEKYEEETVNPEIMKLMIQGIDISINTQDSAGNTPLHYAVKTFNRSMTYCKLEIIELLTEYGNAKIFTNNAGQEPFDLLDTKILQKNSPIINTIKAQYGMAIFRQKPTTLTEELNEYMHNVDTDVH